VMLAGSEISVILRSATITALIMVAAPLLTIANA